MTLLLDCISNPWNLGNALRIARAAEADLALCGSALHLRHRKVRSQIFAWLRPGLKVTFEDLEANTRYFDHFSQAVAHFRSQGRRIIGTCPQAGRNYLDVTYGEGDVIALGHEEGGLGRSKLAMCDLAVRIPMGGGLDSLNVADAAAVILYEARRQQARRAPDSRGGADKREGGPA